MMDRTQPKDKNSTIHCLDDREESRPVHLAHPQSCRPSTLSNIDGTTNIMVGSQEPGYVTNPDGSIDVYFGPSPRVKPIPSWNSPRLLMAYAAFFFDVVVSIFSSRFNASRSLGRCR